MSRRNNKRASIDTSTLTFGIDRAFGASYSAFVGVARFRLPGRGIAIYRRSLIHAHTAMHTHIEGIANIFGVPPELLR